MELAEKLNIHLLMCTESFNYFCTVKSGEGVVLSATLTISLFGFLFMIIIIFITAPCDWYLSYYNIVNGGFLTQPQGTVKCNTVGHLIKL